MIADVQLGDTVIIGAGALGCLHAEVAKVNGAAKLILIQRSELRLNLAKIRCRLSH